ncbi:unnamed protein product [Ectocarpus sp. CCAP 1310/34]|nr:unnamed protein product [Ectocarpus sp. CCAP 1310/34]
MKAELGRTQSKEGDGGGTYKGSVDMKAELGRTQSKVMLWRRSARSRWSWVPAENDEDVLDDLHSATAMMPADSSQLTPPLEEAEEPDQAVEDVVAGEEMDSLTNGIGAVAFEGDEAGGGDKPPPPPPDYEELLPPAPVNGEGSAAAVEGDRGDAVDKVAERGVTNPDGSDAHVEKAAAASAAPVSA